MRQDIERALSEFLLGRVCVLGFGNRLWRDEGFGSILAEALAANSSALVTQRDVRRLESNLQFVVERNDELLSAGLRTRQQDCAYGKCQPVTCSNFHACLL